MNNIPQTSQIGQEKSKKSFILKALLPDLPQIAIRILHKLYIVSNYYKLIYAKQETIGKWVGCCRATVNRALRFLDNILDIEKQSHKTHKYHIPGYLHTEEARLILADFFYKKLKIFLPFMLLSIPPKAAPVSNVTQLSLSNKTNTNKMACESPAVPVLDLSKMLLTARLMTEKMSAAETYAHNNEKSRWTGRKSTQTKQELDQEVNEIIGDHMFDYSDPDWNQDRKVQKPVSIPVVSKLVNKPSKQEIHEPTFEELQDTKIKATQILREQASKAPLNPFAMIALQGLSKQVESFDKKIEPVDIPPMPNPPFEEIDWNSLIPKSALVKEAEVTVVYEAQSVSDNFSLPDEALAKRGPIDIELAKTGHGPFDEEEYIYGEDYEDVFD